MSQLVRKVHKDLSIAVGEKGKVSWASESGRVFIRGNTSTGDYSCFLPEELDDLIEALTLLSTGIKEEQNATS